MYFVRVKITHFRILDDSNDFAQGLEFLFVTKYFGWLLL